MWLNNIYTYKPFIYTNKSEPDSCTAAEPLHVHKLNSGVIVSLLLDTDPAEDAQVPQQNELKDKTSCFCSYIFIRWISCALLEELYAFARHPSQQLAGTFSLSSIIYVSAVWQRWSRALSPHCSSATFSGSTQ